MNSLGVNRNADPNGRWARMSEERKSRVRAYHKRYREENAEKVRLWKSRQLERHPDTAFRRHIKKFYGLSVEDFERKWKEQNGRCCICGVMMARGSKGGQRGCVDHDHNTGVVRGILCNLCNHSLERFERIENFAMRAMEYLDSWGSQCR